ncbi:maleylacetoacetate isomerase [Pseudooceanicola sp.]|jgi:maleylacetoacetate isomerase|uniref:maleylacetoacetate isomerase n=1 Tax=Pseudooceanicola sp. TaxID=1914328 RepID=UPI004057F959
MKLLSRSGSSAAYRCRIALNLKGIDAEVENLRDGAFQEEPYLSLHPQGRIPALLTDAGALVQSAAILEYLDDLVPDPPLLPADPHARARARGVAQIVVSDIHPLQNVGALDVLTEMFGVDESGRRDWARHWIERGLAACEALLARETHGGPYAFGDAPGLADLCLVPQMRNAARFGVDVTPLLRVNAVTEACLVHPAFVAAHPDRHPDPD